MLRPGLCKRKQRPRDYPGPWQKDLIRFVQFRKIIIIVTTIILLLLYYTVTTITLLLLYYTVTTITLLLLYYHCYYYYTFPLWVGWYLILFLLVITFRPEPYLIQMISIFP